MSGINKVSPPIVSKTSISKKKEKQLSTLFFPRNSPDYTSEKNDRIAKGSKTGFSALHPTVCKQKFRHPRGASKLFRTCLSKVFQTCRSGMKHYTKKKKRRATLFTMLRVMPTFPPNRKLPKDLSRTPHARLKGALSAQEDYNRRAAKIRLTRINYQSNSPLKHGSTADAARR